jgi:hypothetical protein
MILYIAIGILSWVLYGLFGIILISKDSYEYPSGLEVVIVVTLAPLLTTLFIIVSLWGNVLEIWDKFEAWKLRE